MDKTMYPGIHIPGLFSQLLLDDPGNIFSDYIEFKIDNGACLYLVEIGYIIGIGNNSDLKGMIL